MEKSINNPTKNKYQTALREDLDLLNNDPYIGN